VPAFPKVCKPCLFYKRFSKNFNSFFGGTGNAITAIKNRFCETDKKGDLPLSFRVTDKFKTDLHDMARIKGVSLSDLCCEYLINSYTEDYKNYLLLQQSGDKTLRDLLR
jgi:hypothetical protein